MSAMICRVCHLVGEPKRKRSAVSDGGAGCLTVALVILGLFFWPLLILAAVTFMVGVVWNLGSRLTRSTEALQCRSCLSYGMLPLESPAARRLVAGGGADAERAAKDAGWSGWSS